MTNRKSINWADDDDEKLLAYSVLSILKWTQMTEVPIWRWQAELKDEPVISDGAETACWRWLLRKTTIMMADRPDDTAVKGCHCSARLTTNIEKLTGRAVTSVAGEKRWWRYDAIDDNDADGGGIDGDMRKRTDDGILWLVWQIDD